jgi:hypothetical protein
LTKGTLFWMLLAGFAAPFTRPGFGHFALLAIGAILAQRRTVTGMIKAAAAIGCQHYSCFHRFFSQGRWNMDEVWFDFVQVAKMWLSEDALVILAADDTLANRTGIRIFGVGLFYGHANESCKSAPVSRGNNWVVVGIIIAFPDWPRWSLFLPTGCELFLKRKDCRKAKCRYRSHSQIAAALLARTAQWLEGYILLAVADGAYANEPTIKPLPKNCGFISRLRSNATLCAEVLPPDPHKPGPRPAFRKVSELPKPCGLWRRLRQKPQRVRIPYPTCRGTLLVKTLIAYWPHVTGPRPILIVITRTQKGAEDYFFSTVTTLTAKQVIEIIARRWSIEIFFRNAKQHMGLEDPACRSEQAVRRTVPFLFFMTGLVAHHFLSRSKHEPELLHQIRPPWDRRKRPPSFADMLAFSREELSAAMRSLNWPRKTKSKDRSQVLKQQDSKVG